MNERMKQICGECLHYLACSAWNVGSLQDTDAGNCVNYTPPVRARWVDTKYTQWPANEIRSCSACGWSIHKSHLRNKDLAWKFCPVCGAQMRTDNESAG